ncbi:MAG: GCN5-related N-acetyltransferase [Blastococcus sp.]|nr:GCN5-related N-acetyltransferase [Blastococcus sp.]
MGARFTAPVQLPGELTARPLTEADARAVFEVTAAQELHDLGRVDVDEADIVGDWQQPSFDVSASTVGIFDGDRLVAYAEVGGEDRGDAAVHPQHRGRGIGTALATWTQELARERGSQVFGMSVPQGSPADELLESLGYFVRWNSWVLQLPEGTQIAAQPLPEGYSIRTAEGETDHRSAWTVIEDAFLEWSERQRRSFEDFCARTVRRPGFQPWHLRIVADADGNAVGACFLIVSGEIGYVAMVAVRKERRGLGLARALLADAFANARDHGATHCELSTDSRTGALGLYERVGMVVTSTWVHRAVDLSRAG